MGWKITVETQSAHILTINTTDLHELLLESEINLLFESKDWIKFPKDSEIMNQVLIELSENNQMKQIQKYFRNYCKNNRNSWNK